MRNAGLRSVGYRRLGLSEQLPQRLVPVSGQQGFIRNVPAPQHARHPGLGTSRGRDLVPETGQVGAGQVGRNPPGWGPVDEAQAEQERLVDVLDRLRLLGQDRSQRGDPDRP